MENICATMFLVLLPSALSLLACHRAAAIEAVEDARSERICMKNGAHAVCMTWNVITRAVELQYEEPGEERQSMRVEGNAQSGYRIGDASGENCLNVLSLENDAEISISACARGEPLRAASQTWVFEPVAPEENSAYRIKSASNLSFCIAARKHPLRGTTVASIVRCETEDPMQIWTRIKAQP